MTIETPPPPRPDSSDDGATKPVGSRGPAGKPVGWRRILRIPGRAWAVWGAVLAAAPASLALVFTIWPGLTPDPGTQLSATMQTKIVDPAVTYRQYLDDVGERPPPDDAPGATVYVVVNIHGRKHEDLDLFYSVYDAKARTRIRQDAPPREPVSAVSADTPNDQWVAPIWVGTLGDEHQKVFVRTELWDGSSMLAFSDTPSFTFPVPPRRP